MQRVKAVQRVRDAISRDLHDDVGATLSSINILNTVVQQRTDKAANTQPILARIDEEVQLLQGKLEEIIWNLRTDRDQLSFLFERIIRFSSELLEAKNIDFRYEIDENIKKINLNMDTRRNIYLIVKEAMNNIAKYSNAKTVTLKIQQQQGKKSKIHISIQDDGIGFDLQTPKQGNGLKNMNARAGEINADFKLFSAKNQGTTVEIIV
jgi:signal transduction histidine kinase